MKRTPRLLIVILVISLLTAGTIFAIRIAKGYRLSLNQKTLQGTGLLSANSIPRGATVFINDKLTTATDDTQNLPPGEYHIKIAKDGYIPWIKTLQLEPELVTQTNARLFPSVPDLKPLTFSGATNLAPSPDGQKIAFVVTNATTDTKNGLYVIDLLDRPLSLKSEPRQITRNSQKYNYSLAQLTWSPDSSQIIASFNSEDSQNLSNLLLSATVYNDLTDIKDITARLPVILTEWNQDLEKKQQERLHTLPDFIQQVATQSADLVFFSPDEDKLMYTATASASIPENLIPPLPATSTQAENRQLEPGNIYIYDLEEDKNFWIAKSTGSETSKVARSQAEGSSEPSPGLSLLASRYSPLNLQNIQWFPDSNHLIIIKEDSIIIAEYDNTNHQTIYAGPFVDSFAYPWPDGNRLIILASLNGGTNLPPNLYSINLK